MLTSLLVQCVPDLITQLIMAWLSCTSRLVGIAFSSNQDQCVITVFASACWMQCNWYHSAAVLASTYELQVCGSLFADALHTEWGACIYMASTVMHLS